LTALLANDDDGPVGPDFSELLRRAKLGDPEARREFHARYEKIVRAVVRRRLGPVLRRRCDSVDVVQSVFEDVFRDLSRFEDRGEEAFRHWLNTKAENKVNDAWRKRLGPDGRLREEALDTRDEARAGGRPGPATEAGDHDDAAKLGKALAKLTPQQREILALRHDHALAFAEIARRLGLSSEDAARMSYGRALKALRKRWDEP
jgi:RNA polymerase sigma-70 factor (ECF subfamily)